MFITLYVIVNTNYMLKESLTLYAQGLSTLELILYLSYLSVERRYMIWLVESRSREQQFIRIFISIIFVIIMLLCCDKQLEVSGLRCLWNCFFIFLWVTYTV